MTVAAGTPLGAYEIVSALGAGGMGEVYRARDRRLKREVALKILPEAFAADPARLARFQREAEVLASLNHPNIAQIYGIEEGPAEAGFSRPVHALAMELVEGPTLAERIGAGPGFGRAGQGGLALDDALAIGKQIAEALEAAHEQGIVHRDLKPANVKVRPDGIVKVLDFGLAKLTESGSGRRDAGSAGASQAPTLSSPAMVSAAGMILGTAAYMAPEQARGGEVDMRADVWAFGCVLFEMLTGQRAFAADGVSDTLAMVLLKEPDWSRLPANTPPAVRTLLRRCLEKDRRRRLPAIGAARLEIEDALSAPPSAEVPQGSAGAARQAPPGRRSYPAWATATLAVVAMLGVVAALGIAAVHFREPAPDPPASIQFQVSAPSGFVLADDDLLSLALAPNGRQLAFVVATADAAAARGAAATRSIAVRDFDSGEARVLPGTEGAAGPFWSPDSRMIAFFTQGKLKKIDVNGGPVQLVCDLPFMAVIRNGGTWNEAGTILLSMDSGSILRVSSAGGKPAPVTTVAGTEVAQRRPWFLPDQRHFLYYSDPIGPSGGTTRIGSIDSAQTVELGPADSMAEYAAGRLLFVRDQTLMSQAFDLDRLATMGEPVVVADGVYFNSASGAASFSASAGGVIALRTATSGVSTQLVLVDRVGKQLESIGEKADQTALALSPDATRLAISVFDPSRRTRDIWMHDLRRNLRSRFTFDAGDDLDSAWSPDGMRLFFSATRPTLLNIYQQPTDGSGREEQLVDASGPNKYVTSVSPDGSVLLYYNGGTGSATGNDIWALSTTPGGTPKSVVQTSFADQHGVTSPDGRWVAYTSFESGRNEVYVSLYPGPGGKWQVSSGGGTLPRWRRDGKELYFLAGNRLMAAAVNGAGAAFQVGAVEQLFEARVRTQGYQGYGIGYVYDVFPDGQRFVINQLAEDQAVAPPITVITNWTSTLR